MQGEDKTNVVRPFVVKQNKRKTTKPYSYVFLNSKSLNAFPSKFRNKATRPLFTLFLFSIVLEVPATAVRQEREREGIQIAKEEIKSSLRARDVAVFVKSSKESTEKQNKNNPPQIKLNPKPPQLELVSSAKSWATRSTHKNQLHLYILTMNMWQVTLKTIHN